MNRLDCKAYALEPILQNTLDSCRKVLSTTRNPKLPENVEHTYNDKITLAQWSVKGGVWSILNLLVALGLCEKTLGRLIAWNQESRPVTLAWRSVSSHKFVREINREVSSDSKVCTTVESNLPSKKKEFSTFVKTTITEYEWQLTEEWKLTAFPGTAEATESIVLNERHSVCTLKTGAKIEPALTGTFSKDVSLDWILQRLSKEGEAKTQLEFSIDRNNKECHTPTRNPDVTEALKYLDSLKDFFRLIISYVRQVLDRQYGTSKKKFSLMEMMDDDCNPCETRIFRPVLAMFCFEDRNNEMNGPYLASHDLDNFVSEMMRTLDERTTEYKIALLSIVETEEAFQKPLNENVVLLDEEKSLLCEVECKIAATSALVTILCDDIVFSVGRVERMLSTQLIEAIGKEVTPSDFDDLIVFHNQRLFNSQYRPRAFCYAIRKPQCSLEGTIELLKSDDKAVNTMVFKSEAQRAMSFDLSASTSVSFLGNQFVHVAVMHNFSDAPVRSLKLFANARQFSSFILLVGSIASTEIFKPSAALIIKDMDSLCIPLDLETIPTPKEFKDAIRSLSPQQQEFCKTFREFQLSSTLFGVVVIQIKPQLERVLNLPAEALTKEIQLTQDLMQLFITHQVPTDLVSFQGPPSFSQEEKLASVKRDVQKIQTMIDNCKKAEIEQKAQEAEYSLLQNEVDNPSIFPKGNVESMPFTSVRQKPEVPARKARFSNVERLYSGSFSREISASQQQQDAHNTGFGMTCCSVAADSGEFGSQNNAVLQNSYERQPPNQVLRDAKAVNTHVEKNPNEQVLISGGEAVWNASIDDYTSFPGVLDRRCDRFDADSALRPTIIKPSSVWSKTEHGGLLSNPKQISLYSFEQKNEKQRAFDLLDALSRSGVLPCDDAELHVVCAYTHNFDETLLNVLLKENVNPLSSIERSSLIVASTLHNLSVIKMVQPAHLETIKKTCPVELLEEISSDD